MPDPRDGLQRRYTMDEILELHGGRAGVKPLNYDALLMLKNPLYVKMGQTISETISDQNKKMHPVAPFEEAGGPLHGLCP